MTNERLEQLKLTVARAESLTNDIGALQECEYESNQHNLSYLLRCEVYRLGRDLLLRQKEAELESLLAEPKPEPEDKSELSVATEETAECCESMAQYGRCNA